MTTVVSGPEKVDASTLDEPDDLSPSRNCDRTLAARLNREKFVETSDAPDALVASY